MSHEDEQATRNEKDQRVYVAAMALSGLLASGLTSVTDSDLNYTCAKAILFADTLIAKLKK